VIDGQAVSVVIPTIGRASLRRAVESALHQTSPPLEVIVVVDADCDPDVPDSDSIRVLRTSGGVGPSCAKHVGVESARGDVIALLDDDDLWRPRKLEKQLAAAPPGDEWIVSCRYVIHEDECEPVTGPRTLILPDERIGAYLFQLRARREYRYLPVPTLVFPREVARRVPLSVSAGSIHDDPKWLLEVRRALPNLPIIQVPEPLVDVIVTPRSVSRPGVDRSREFIDWGVRELADESKRVRGDYFLTNPLGSARAVGSFRGVARSIVAGVRSGRPGPWAWGSAAMAMLRIACRRAKSVAARATEGLWACAKSCRYAL
jgi:glycosyltransferase involved in cell wall biosynthesis